MRAASLTVVVLLALFAAVPSPADTTAEPISFAACAEVRIAELTVFVTDRQGRPVHGLTVDDFKLSIGGRRQELHNFYEMSGKESEGTDVVPEPLILIVYLDNVNIHPLNRGRFLEEFKEFLYAGLVGPVTTMLVTNDRFHRARISWAGQGSLDVRQAMTEDPTRIAFALDQLENLRGDRTYYDLERQDILREISRAEVGDPMSRWRIFNRVKTYAASIFNDVKFSVRALGDFVESLNGLEGHTVLLYVSDGFPMRAGEDLYYVLKEKYGSESVGMEGFHYDVNRLLEGVVGRANANGISIYTLDTSGLAGQSSTSAASASGILTSMIDTVRRKNRQNPLLYLSRQSGGRAMVDTTRLGPSLNGITGDFHSYYSLGYRPDPEAGEVEQSVKVKVRGRGRRLRHRRTVSETTPERRMEGAIRACLHYGYRNNPLGLSLELGEVESVEPGRVLADCTVVIPVGELTFVDHGDGPKALVRLFVAVEDEQRVLSPVREVPVMVDRPEAQGESPSHRYRLRLLMAHGRQTLVVGAMDDLSCRTSFVSLACRVGGPPPMHKEDPPLN